jgi:hypothetical protein
MDYPISLVHLYKERRRLYELKKELKAQIKSAIEGNSKAKFKLANRKPFKDGALALSSPPKSKPSKKSSSSKLSTKNWKQAPPRSTPPRTCKTNLANVAQNESDPAAPQEPHASNVGGIESSTPLVSNVSVKGKGKKNPAKGKKMSDDDQNKQSKRKRNKESKNIDEKDPSNVVTDPSEKSEEKRGRQAVTDATESKSKKSRKSSIETNKKLPLRQKISVPTSKNVVTEVKLVNIEDISRYGKQFSNAFIPGWPFLCLSTKFVQGGVFTIYQIHHLIQYLRIDLITNGLTLANMCSLLHQTIVEGTVDDVEWLFSKIHIMNSSSPSQLPIMLRAENN